MVVIVVALVILLVVGASLARAARAGTLQVRPVRRGAHGVGRTKTGGSDLPRGPSAP